MITLSYAAHTILSISLHILGILMGLFVWYLFPKYPTRTIMQLPSERVAIHISPPTVHEEVVHEKLIDIDEPEQQIRQFG
ncbi:unnamed protein product [Caenorhabditis bovis]|uniref:Uncharacterized protein n=1 Tax=Caenorhabditis bovis TaxID=2654633 RepID=A0A8S1EU57_9PELO|nr:unnamed protein product [Caenorhabditis bovis]